jgi:hypothetical protein
MVLEYFMTYDLFGYGLYGSFIGMAYFVAIALASTAPYVKKPLHKVFELLVPVYLIGFILSVIGFPSILTGLIVIGAYLLSMKNVMNLDKKTWFPIVVSFAGIMIIFSFVPFSLRDYIFIFLIIYIFVQGKISMRNVGKMPLLLSNSPA